MSTEEGEKSLGVRFSELATERLVPATRELVSPDPDVDAVREELRDVLDELGELEGEQ